MNLTADQRRRTLAALTEAVERRAKVSARKVFDVDQQAEKDKEVAFLNGHIAKLNRWLDGVEGN